ncbi:hypothetical protein BB558_002761 [Smittium angustum]|uniref:DUF8032 domain-containing protein n=1 Tax=Smittium angustum TaxID=133377 RepID=A0A2U1J7Z5_SMIAN|nr:hypothetical protein BB558_002761 [Smittium angustum]
MDTSSLQNTGSTGLGDDYNLEIDLNSDFGIDINSSNIGFSNINYSINNILDHQNENESMENEDIYDGSAQNAIFQLEEQLRRYESLTTQDLQNNLLDDIFFPYVSDPHLLHSQKDLLSPLETTSAGHENSKSTSQANINNTNNNNASKNTPGGKIKNSLNTLQNENIESVSDVEFANDSIDGTDHSFLEHDNNSANSTQEKNLDFFQNQIFKNNTLLRVGQKGAPEDPPNTATGSPTLPEMLFNRNIFEMEKYENFGFGDTEIKKSFEKGLNENEFVGNFGKNDIYKSREFLEELMLGDYGHGFGTSSNIYNQKTKKRLTREGENTHLDINEKKQKKNDLNDLLDFNFDQFEDSHDPSALESDMHMPISISDLNPQLFDQRLVQLISEYGNLDNLNTPLEIDEFLNNSFKNLQKAANLDLFPKDQKKTKHRSETSTSQESESGTKLEYEPSLNTKGKQKSKRKASQDLLFRGTGNNNFLWEYQLEDDELSLSSLQKRGNEKDEEKKIEPNEDLNKGPTYHVDNEGIPHISFTYTKRGQLLRHTIRCDIDKAPISEIPRVFRLNNCVYPGAYCNRSEYKGNRWNYETTCNDYGWRLSFLNQEQLAGKRGMLQRAVDSYRILMSGRKNRRISKQQKLMQPEYIVGSGPNGLLNYNTNEPQANGGNRGETSKSSLASEYQNSLSGGIGDLINQQEGVKDPELLKESPSSRKNTVSDRGEQRSLEFRKQHVLQKLKEISETLHASSSTLPKMLLVDVYTRSRFDRIRIRADISSVNSSSVSVSFMRSHCVYPRALDTAKERYRGALGRWAFEVSCNEIAWKLAWLNQPRLTSKRPVMQKCLDAYRWRLPQPPVSLLECLKDTPEVHSDKQFLALWISRKNSKKPLRPSTDATTGNLNINSTNEYEGQNQLTLGNNIANLIPIEPNNSLETTESQNLQSALANALLDTVSKNFIDNNGSSSTKQENPPNNNNEIPGSAGNSLFAVNSILGPNSKTNFTASELASAVVVAAAQIVGGISSLDNNSAVKDYISLQLSTENSINKKLSNNEVSLLPSDGNSVVKSNLAYSTSLSDSTHHDPVSNQNKKTGIHQFSTFSTNHLVHSAEHQIKEGTVNEHDTFSFTEKSRLTPNSIEHENSASDDILLTTKSKLMDRFMEDRSFFSAPPSPESQNWPKKYLKEPESSKNLNFSQSDKNPVIGNDYSKSNLGGTSSKKTENITDSQQPKADDSVLLEIPTEAQYERDFIDKTNRSIDNESNTNLKVFGDSANYHKISSSNLPVSINSLPSKSSNNLAPDNMKNGQNSGFSHLGNLNSSGDYMNMATPSHVSVLLKNGANSNQFEAKTFLQQQIKQGSVALLPIAQRPIAPLSTSNSVLNSTKNDISKSKNTRLGDLKTIKNNTLPVTSVPIALKNLAPIISNSVFSNIPGQPKLAPKQQLGPKSQNSSSNDISNLKISKKPVKTKKKQRLQLYQTKQADKLGDPSIRPGLLAIAPISAPSLVPITTTSTYSLSTPGPSVAIRQATNSTARGSGKTPNVTPAKKTGNTLLCPKPVVTAPIAGSIAIKPWPYGSLPTLDNPNTDLSIGAQYNNRIKQPLKTKNLATPRKFLQNQAATYKEVSAYKLKPIIHSKIQPHPTLQTNDQSENTSSSLFEQPGNPTNVRISPISKLPSQQLEVPVQLQQQTGSNSEPSSNTLSGGATGGTNVLQKQKSEIAKEAASIFVDLLRQLTSQIAQSSQNSDPSSPSPVSQTTSNMVGSKIVDATGTNIALKNTLLNLNQTGLSLNRPPTSDEEPKINDSSLTMLKSDTVIEGNHNTPSKLSVNKTSLLSLDKSENKFESEENKETPSQNLENVVINNKETSQTTKNLISESPATNKNVTIDNNSVVNFEKTSDDSLDSKTMKLGLLLKILSSMSGQNSKLVNTPANGESSSAGESSTKVLDSKALPSTPESIKGTFTLEKNQPSSAEKFQLGQMDNTNLTGYENVQRNVSIGLTPIKSKLKSDLNTPEQSLASTFVSSQGVVQNSPAKNGKPTLKEIDSEAKKPDLISQVPILPQYKPFPNITQPTTGFHPTPNMGYYNPYIPGGTFPGQHFVGIPPIQQPGQFIPQYFHQNQQQQIQQQIVQQAITAAILAKPPPEELKRIIAEITSAFPHILPQLIQSQIQIASSQAPNGYLKPGLAQNEPNSINKANLQIPIQSKPSSIKQTSKSKPKMKVKPKELQSNSSDKIPQLLATTDSESMEYVGENQTSQKSSSKDLL